MWGLFPVPGPELLEEVLKPEQIRALFPDFTPFWTRHPELLALWNHVQEADPECRLVGGCVRDALLGRETTDLDLGTRLPAPYLMAQLRRKGLRVLPHGLDFGSIRLVHPPWTLDITTLRQDVRCDGRHAEIAPVSSWTQDARRRDLTLNTLGMDQAGCLYNPVGGLEDLHAGRVRFVGKPAERIREDCLRMLRFVRFHQFYARTEPDPAATEACTRARHEIVRLSRERIAQEWLRILEGPRLLSALALMQRTGLDEVLWGKACAMEAATCAWNLLEGLPPCPLPGLPSLRPLQVFAASMAPWGTPPDITRLTRLCVWPKALLRRLGLMLDLSHPVPEPWEVPHIHTPSARALAVDRWIQDATALVMHSGGSPEQAAGLLSRRLEDLDFLLSHPLPVSGVQLKARGLGASSFPLLLGTMRRLWLASRGAVSAPTLLEHASASMKTG